MTTPDPTPRTEEHINANYAKVGHALVCHDFARTLERENAALRARCERAERGPIEVVNHRLRHLKIVGDALGWSHQGHTDAKKFAEECAGLIAYNKARLAQAEAEEADLKGEVARYKGERDSFREQFIEASNDTVAASHDCEVAEAQLAKAEAEVARLTHELVSGGHSARRDFVTEANLLLATKNETIADLRAYAAKLRVALEDDEPQQPCDASMLEYDEWEKDHAAWQLRHNQALALPVPGDERKTQSNGLR